MNYQQALKYLTKYIHRKTNIDLTQIRPELNLTQDLGLDSLDKMDLLMQLEKRRVTIDDDKFLETSTLAGLASLISQEQIA